MKPAMTLDCLPLKCRLLEDIRIDGQQMKLRGVIFDKVKSLYQGEITQAPNVGMERFLSTSVTKSVTLITRSQLDIIMDGDGPRPSPNDRFSTVEGRIARMSTSALPSNWIVFFPGANHFYVIRKEDKVAGTFKLICQCYFDNMEKAEMMALYKRAGKEIVLE
jgi:hypothetical protein